ncbi:hypothetical protein NMY22_g13458 [Coprinellus aureogranulatus]|nr:hypothetical protein NMY22_g13458 [Coprinellus aureogranulatus]
MRVVWVGEVSLGGVLLFEAALAKRGLLKPHGGVLRTVVLAILGPRFKVDVLLPKDEEADEDGAKLDDEEDEDEAKVEVEEQLIAKLKEMVPESGA